MRTLSILFSFAAFTLMAQLPDGPGKAETDKQCRTCHEIERSISLRQDLNGWNQTLTKMVGFGMRASDTELALIAKYLSTHYPADAMPPINVNTATNIELESRFSMKRSESNAFIAYREKIGKFKTFADLAKAPGLKPEKLEAKKTQIIF
jgi:competence ComEA-like helix-hairpin-helix protein